VRPARPRCGHGVRVEDDRLERPVRDSKNDGHPVVFRGGRHRRVPYHRAEVQHALIVRASTSRDIPRDGETVSPVRATRCHRMYAARVPADPAVVVVPAGDAVLGDPPTTTHVNVFAIAKRPVSNREFGEFSTAATYPAPAWTRGAADDLAEGLSWADAVAYCRWLSVATARVYRLPDEREWEKAARAGVLEALGQVRAWANTCADGARVIRAGSRRPAR